MLSHFLGPICIKEKKEPKVDSVHKLQIRDEV